MAVRERFIPPVDISTGAVSAKASGCAILRPLPSGGYIGFERSEDAIFHATAQIDPRHADRLAAA